MSETSHLLLKQRHITVGTTDLHTTDCVLKDSLAGTKKVKSWLENVSLLQRSARDIKRHELLAGNIGTAAYLIRDAVLGDEYVVEDPTIGAYNPFSSSNAKNLLRNEISIMCRKYCSSWTVLRMLHYSVASLLLLTFLEPPHWCRNYRRNVLSPDGRQQELLLGCCDTILRLSGKSSFEMAYNNTIESNIVEYYPNTSTAVWLSVPQSHLLEIFFVSIITVVSVLRLGRDGCSFAIYLRRSAGTNIQCNRTCQILCIALLFLGVYLEYRTQDEKFTILHPYIRLILLYTFLGGTPRDIQALLGMLPVRFLDPILHGKLKNLTFLHRFVCVGGVKCIIPSLYTDAILFMVWCSYVC